MLATYLLALALQLLSSINSHGQLRAGTNDDYIRLGITTVHDVSTLLNTLSTAARQVGHALARQSNGGWASAVSHSHLVCSSCLIATAWAHHQHVGHGTEAGQVLDGLMGGPVLTKTDGVVGHHIDGTNLQGKK